MTIMVEAVVENGLLRPMQPLPLKENERVRITIQPNATFKESVAAEVEALAALQVNWDSYGAPAIDRNIIAAGVQFVRSLPDDLAYRPRVVPMAPGNLQLEWHEGQKILELEFETPTTIRFLKWSGDEKFSEEDMIRVSDTHRALDLIQWFITGANT